MRPKKDDAAFPNTRQMLLYAIALALAPLGFVSYQTALFAMLGIIPAAIFGLPELVFRLRERSGRLSTPKSERKRRPNALLFMALIAVWLLGYWVRLEMAERQFQPLIDAAHAHHERVGTYPRYPEDLPPEVWEPFERDEVGELQDGTTIVGLDSFWLGNAAYYSASATRFDITFITYGFMKHSYGSRRPGWTSWD